MNYSIDIIMIQISNAFLLFVLVISICIQVTLTKIFLSVLNNKTDVF